MSKTFKDHLLSLAIAVGILFGMQTIGFTAAAAQDCTNIEQAQEMLAEAGTAVSGVFLLSEDELSADVAAMLGASEEQLADVNSILVYYLTGGPAAIGVERSDGCVVGPFAVDDDVYVGLLGANVHD